MLWLKRYQKIANGIGTRLLIGHEVNGNGNAMEKLRRDGIGTRNGKITVKDQNGKIMVKMKRDEMEILQALLHLLRKSLYGSGCRKLCKG